MKHVASIASVEASLPGSGFRSTVLTRNDLARHPSLPRAGFSKRQEPLGDSSTNVPDLLPLGLHCPSMFILGLDGCAHLIRRPHVVQII
jgi:hypothetical protein